MSNAKNPRLLANDKKVLFILLAHIPFVALLAPIGYDTFNFAISMTVLITVLSLVSYFLLRGSRGFGILSGVFFMLYSATLIQTQMGRIDMHFHIFVALAFLLIYKDWLVVVVAAGVGAVHHVLLTYLQLNQVEVAGMPIILFNYDCNWGITFLHALFVVIEAAVLVYYSVTMRKEEEVADNVMNTINQVSENADFSSRISEHQTHPSVIATNTLLTSIESAFSEINGVMNAIAHGDFDKRVKHEFHGDLDTLKQAVNDSAQSVTNTMSSLKTLMDGIGHGDFTARLPQHIAEPLRGQVNSAMQQTETTLTEISNVMNGLAKSDFTNTVQADVKGQWKPIKSAINQAVSELNHLFELLNNSMQQLADGDLTIQLNNQMQGQAKTLVDNFNTSIEKQRVAMNDVMQVAQVVTHGVTNISSGNIDLASRTQESAAMIEETASAMEEMVATIQQNTENTQLANDLAVKTSDVASGGSEVMQKTITSMHNIKDSSQKIEEIVSIIDSIAFQTNLLALNAAVEAARAGEHGRGFAVVASEVRNLAGRSSDAANDIKKLITASVAEISTGAKLSEQSGDSLNQIVESIQEMKNMVSQVTLSSGEQSTTASEIGRAVSQMDSTVQKNAALVEQVGETSKSILDSANLMIEKLGNFKTKH
ncbi:MAG: hypothetical protein JXK16_00940 [Thiotrichales bacterium]|nr:hypothetical protein [Thiotrichales bacterium]